MRGGLRPMRVEDVDAVVDVQRRGSVIALAAVFPQETHPFPTPEVTARWRAELADPSVAAHVWDDGAALGFAASRGAELFHLGVDPDHWGTGLAVALHDALVATMPPDRLWLRVFEANARARRFYERLGWCDTGERTRSTFEPRPVLCHYELARPGARPSSGHSQL